MSLSVIVITKNESLNIRDCLQSVQFADQIIVLDSGSTDNTVEICNEFTSHVYVTPDWPGDGPQKIRALKYATQEWVLILDADERVSPELQEELMMEIHPEQKNINGYKIPFQSKYCGHILHYGDWHNEYHLRLFKRSCGTIANYAVHCHVKVSGKIGRLKNYIHHESYPNLESVIYKINVYSSLSALQKYNSKIESSLSKAILHGLWTFFRGYCFKFGFLDGKKGFMLAFSNAECTYYKYLKLSLLHKKELKTID